MRRARRSAYLARRFCQWIREKYGTQERRSEAWGGKRRSTDLPARDFPPGASGRQGQHPPIGKSLVLGRPAYDRRVRKQRLLDTMWVSTVSKTSSTPLRGGGARGGYRARSLVKLEAGRASAFLQPHSDALVGTVDRTTIWRRQRQPIDNATLLAGRFGTLSAGMQQVADRRSCSE